MGEQDPDHISLAACRALIQATIEMDEAHLRDYAAKVAAHRNEILDDLAWKPAPPQPEGG